MPRSIIKDADSLKVGDTVSLNEPSVSDSKDVYYVDLSYLNREYELPIGTIHVAQVLRIEKRSSGTFLHLLSCDGRFLEIIPQYGLQFALYNPEVRKVSLLLPGDEILMRGDFNPARWKSETKFLLLALQYGYSSTVLRIRKQRNGNYKMSVLFAGVKKFKFSVDSDTLFELSYSLR